MPSRDSLEQTKPYISRNFPSIQAKEPTMQIFCPHCKNPINSEGINLDRLIAKCTSCRAVFRFSEDELATTSPERDDNNPKPTTAQDTEENSLRKGPINRPQRRSPRIQEPIPLDVPEGMTLQHDEHSLRVRWRWFTFEASAVALVCALFVGAALALYNETKSSYAYDSLWPILFLILCFLGVSMALLYYSLALLINATTLTIQNGLLSIQHAPLPWWGNRTLPAEEFEQFYCKQRVSRGKYRLFFTYELHAILRNKQRIKLLSGISEIEKVLFLERLIEDHLGIVDRPVLGELEP